MRLPTPNPRKWRPLLGGMVELVYGHEELADVLMLTRVKLTPSTRRGQLMFHVFHRGDQDDPHDHPWYFWTFPLHSYSELAIMDSGGDRVVIPRFKWTRRPAEYVHKVEGRLRRMSTHHWWCTLVWHGPEEREWGFWVFVEEETTERVFVPWRRYLYGEGD